MGGVDWTVTQKKRDYALRLQTVRVRHRGLKKVEAQLVAHQQGQLWYEQKIKFMKIDLDDKTDVLTYHKKLLAETMKEKEDLKAKVEKWHNSSKNLCKLINTQMSANDKFGLGYGDHRYDVILSYENEVLQSVFKCTATPELVSEPVGNESNVACQPNVWSDAPIIEEYESYSEDEYVSIPTKEQETPSFANQQVKAPRETIKNHFTHSKNHKFDKKELGYGFNARASFVCRSLNHLIRDCDLHEKMMAKQAELNNRLNRNSINTARTSGTKNVSTARHSFNRQAVLTSAAMKVNTVKPIVNSVNAVSAVGGKRETAIKPSAIRDHKDTTGTMHMTEQGLPCEFKLNGGLVTFGGCKEFKNKDFIEFCGSKGIKREYSNARTPQQNGVAERKNRTLIEAARTMLADSFLPNTFWAEAVSTACYVLNRVLVTKPHNKTPYELVTGKIPIISYIRPFGCHVTILNTIDHLGKFDGKSDEGFLVGYSLQSKAFRVYNLETKRVEENLHITFLENKPNVAGKGPTWLFDLDYLTDSMNYQPVRSENQANKHAGPQEANHNAGTKDNIDAGDSEIEAESAQDYFVLPIWSSYTSTVKSSKANNAGEEPTKHPDLKPVDKEDQAGAAKASSTNIVNTASTPVSTASPYGGLSFTDLTNTDQDDSEIPALEEIYDNPTAGIFTNASYDDEGAVADFTNLETVVNVSPIPTSRINSIHPSTLILGDPQSAVQTRSKVTNSSGAHAFKISEALEDESWVDAMQEELLQFKIQKVWILVDNELNELRDHAYENSLIYKEKTKRIHDSKIKNRVFNVGDRVLLFNSRLKIFSGKLKTRWSGPFTVTQVFPYGTVELSQNSGPNFKVNGHRLKHYFGGDVPTEDFPDCEDSRALSFIFHSQEFRILSFILGIHMMDEEAARGLYGDEAMILKESLMMLLVSNVMEFGVDVTDNNRICYTFLEREEAIYKDLIVVVVIIRKEAATDSLNIDCDQDKKQQMKKSSSRFMWCAHGCLIFIMESMDLIRLQEVCSWLYDVYEEAAGVIDIGLIFNHGAIDVYCLWI
ncbi:ribonuclease H-like domain-containing protein [Tanacetum coccineum]